MKLPKESKLNGSRSGQSRSGAEKRPPFERTLGEQRSGQNANIASLACKAGRNQGFWNEDEERG